MESVRRLGTTVHEFWRGVIEWRSPVSGPYLMLVNAAFWSAALYCSELVQLRLLLSIAAGVVGWDILLSPTHERSIATHVALWPIQSIWRTLSVCGCLYSSHQLQLQQLESACITAYATVGCLLVNPVWNYYEVNQKIATGALYCGRKTADAATVVIVHPLQRVYQILKYIVLLQFVPPLWRAFKSTVTEIGVSISNGVSYVVTRIKNGAIYVATLIKNGVLYIVTSIKNGIIYVALSIKNGIVFVVTSIRNGIVYVVTSIKNGIVYVATAIKNGVIYVATTIKNSIVYVVTSIRDGIYWIGRGIKNGILATLRCVKHGILATGKFFKDLFIQIEEWVSMRIVEPTKNAVYAVGRWLKYWFGAYWWPDLKNWIRLKIGEPLRHAFNYFCYGLMYVFCGYWIPPLKAFLRKWLGRLKDFTTAQLQRLAAFLHRTVVVPTKSYLRRKFDEFRSWLRQFLHRIAVAIRDSILWPICLLVVDAGRELSLLMYRFLLQPVIDYMYVRYKIIEDAILIHFLGPVCDTIVKNIPEKSPFCDDSDVELEGLLPEEITDEVERAAASGIESDDSLADLEPPPPPPLDEEEGDFVSGLAFPTIHASESSDEEFDLNTRKLKQELKRRTRRQREDADNGAAPEVPTPEPPPRRHTGGGRTHDDDFELLQ